MRSESHRGIEEHHRIRLGANLGVVEFRVETIDDRDACGKLPARRATARGDLLRIDPQLARMPPHPAHRRLRILAAFPLAVLLTA